MNPSDFAGLTPQQQLYVLYIAIAFKALGVIYSALRTGGGLKRILKSLWFGETVPAPIAKDYRCELTEVPFRDRPDPPVAVPPPPPPAQ